MALKRIPMVDETRSDEENARLWAEEAQRRDQAWDADPAEGRPVADVFRDARARLKGLFRPTHHPEV
jgi:hypothetical protein